MRFKKVVFRSSVLLASILLSFSSEATQNAVPGEYLIKYKNQVNPNNAAQKISHKVQMKGYLKGALTFHVKLNANGAGGFDESTLAELKSDPEVEYVEPNFYLNKSEEGPVKVLNEGEVMGLSNSSGGQISYSQSKALVQVNEAWQTMTPAGTQGDKIVVAVIDTGLDSNHELFKSVAEGGTGALWVNHQEIPGNGIDDDYNGYVDDVSGWNYITNASNPLDDDGHGTHVSGIILGASLDIFAYQLPESPILIMPLKFLDGDGAGTTANAIKAIYYAVNNGARVINNSWGGGNYSRALHDAYNFAYDHKVLLTTAAGNSALNNDIKEMYPANLDTPSNISVAATDDFDRLASFSDYGISKVHLGSPGYMIVSSYPGNRYAMMSGTSMAAPFVAGVAALVFREAPQLTGYQVSQVIMGAVDGVSSLNGKVSSGGRVNVLKSIEAGIQAASTEAFQPGYAPVYAAERAPASSSAGQAPAAGGCGIVTKALMEGPGKGEPLSKIGMLVGLLLLPVFVLAFVYRREKQGADGRQHDRYQLNSQVRINVGGQFLTGAISTISQGGLSFDVDAALESGGIVKMQIQGPNGQEMVEVEGKIVWSKEEHAYGVQFTQSHEGIKGMISQWTKGLAKSSS